MRWKRTIQLLDVHCAGEIGKVAIGGVPKIPGNSIAEQLHHINTVDDSLRRFLCLEPRAASIGSVNLLVPPKRPEADAGFIILQADQAHAMSGSNSICVTTALLESGIVEMKEPETVVMLRHGGRSRQGDGELPRRALCERVTLTMVPSFVEALDVGLDTPDWGRITLDLCFGGIFYALVDVHQIGTTIEKANAAVWSRPAWPSRSSSTARSRRFIPRSGNFRRRLCHVPPDRGGRHGAHLHHTMWPGRVDRSPCGTGSSANLATLHARGLAKPGDVFTSRSIIGSEFKVGLERETEVAGARRSFPPFRDAAGPSACIRLRSTRSIRWPTASR